MNNKVEPRILSGFMELLPEDQILFNKLKDDIRSVYESFGYLPLDTPVIEYSEVLLAKAGGETEKQIYRFNKGDNDLSLRFDLTVPLARYVAQRFNNLSFPFKRYQIGKVFRGERPQQGRFREFYQCDIDVIGNGELSLLFDAEIPAVIYNIFKKMNIGKFTILINNRKLLNGFFDSLDIGEDKVIVMRIIDKIKKVDESVIVKDLKNIDLNDETISKILSFVNISGTNEEKLDKLRKLNINNEVFKKGLEELETVFKYINTYGIDESYYSVDLSISRGLDYYTGTVYETFLDEYPSLGSICSGGRYEDLCSYYTEEKFPGVGISIGLTRLFSKLKEMNMIESLSKSLSKVLIISMDDDFTYPIKVATDLRNNGIITEIYYLNKPMKKKFAYADKLGIPNVIILGEDEIKNNIVSLKDMTTGTQESLNIEEVIKRLK